MKQVLFIAGLLLLASVSINAQETISESFDGLALEGPLIVELVQGSSNSITRVEHADEVTWKVENGSLRVEGEKADANDEAPRIKIVVSELENLAISDGVILNAEEGGLKGDEFNLAVSDQSIVNIKLEVEELNAAVDDQSILNVKGSAEEVNLAVDNQSIANVKEVEMEEINVSADQQSVVEVGRGRNIEMNTHTENQSIIN